MFYYKKVDVFLIYLVYIFYYCMEFWSLLIGCYVDNYNIFWKYLYEGIDDGFEWYLLKVGLLIYSYFFVLDNFWYSYLKEL